MSFEEQKENALVMIDSLIEDLSSIIQRATEERDFNTARENLKRWKERAITQISESISAREGQKLQEKRKMSFIAGQPLRNLADEADMYRTV